MAKMIRTAFPRRHLPAPAKRPTARQPRDALSGLPGATGGGELMMTTRMHAHTDRIRNLEMAGRTFGPDAAGLDRSAKRRRERNPGRREPVVVRALTSGPGHQRAGARPRPTASQHDQSAAASAHAHRSPTSGPYNGQRPHARYSAQIGTARVLLNLLGHLAIRPYRAELGSPHRHHRRPGLTPPAQPGRGGRSAGEMPGRYSRQRGQRLAEPRTHGQDPVRARNIWWRAIGRHRATQSHLSI